MTEKEIDLDSLKVEAWLVDRPKDAKNNNKIHTTDSLQRLAKSMSELGQIQPIIVDKNEVIIAGHGRRKAAQMLGLKYVKVIQLPVTEKVARKMRIADNLTPNQNYDYKALGEELRELQDLGDDLASLGESLGFDQKMLDLVVPDLTDATMPEEDAISKDVSEDVESLHDEKEDALEKAESGEVAVTKVLGFTKITAAQAREVRAFMAEAMDETGKDDPCEAFMEKITQS